MKKHPILIGLALILFLLPVGMFTLLNSQTGSRWLVHRLLTALPAQTSLAGIEGNLWTQIDLRQLHYETEAESISIDRLTLAWQPAQLLRGTLKLVNISLDGVSIVIKQSQPSESDGFDWNADLPMPLQLILDQLSITHLHYQDGETDYQLQALKLSAHTEQHNLNITALTLDASPLSLQLTGKVGLGHDFPYAVSSQWRMATAEYGLWQATTLISGDSNDLRLDHQQASPFRLTLKGALSHLQTQPAINARGDWQQLTWPLAGGQTQFGSEQGFFEIKGPLDGYHLLLAGPVTQPYLPDAKLRFEGNGSTDAMIIDDLHLASESGFFQLNGRVDWRTATAFDLNASGKNFNPAIFMPDLPGKLSFDSHINAKLDDSGAQIQLAINSLAGQLRGNPVTASGRLAMTDQTIGVDALKIQSGKNKISANGQLAPADSKLAIDIDTPALASLWPGLAGSLKGGGQIQGNWRNPRVLFQAQGKALQFAGLALGQLAMDIDYRPDSGTASKIKLNASQIRTADVSINSLALNGAGHWQQHQFTLDIQGPDLSLSSVLSGLVDQGEWQGRLSSLHLDNPDWGGWRLAAPADIHTTQHAAGMDVDLSPTCLTQNQASICFNAQYQANTDFQARLKVTGLPGDTVNAYLPAQVRLKTRIDADAEFQQHQGLLKGRYRLDMPADSHILLKQAKDSQALPFGGLKLDGSLDDNRLNATAQVSLTGNDFVRAAVQYDARSSRIGSGTINASIRQWDLIQAIVPGISRFTGHLAADLNISGNPADPSIGGNLDFTHADIDLADAGLGLHDLDLHLLASGNKLKPISIQGAANPVFLPRPEAEQALQFQGRVDFTATVRQLRPLIGRYELTLPANSSLGYDSAQTHLTIPFAASSLTGDFSGDEVSASLALSLLNQDFVRAKLHANTGSGNSIAGQVNASIRDLSLIDVLAPDLTHTKGQLKADLTIHGALDKPVAEGFMEMTQGATEISKLGIALHDVNLRLSSMDNGESLQVAGDAKSGPGQISLSGVVNLQGKTDLLLQGLDFEVAKLPEAQVNISPHLNLALAEDSSKISGRLDIPKALISLQEIPANAVTVSDDEIILGQTDTAKTAAKAIGLDANIDVELGKQVHFSGLGLDTDLTGVLQISRSDTRTSMHGAIDMKKGRYQSYGQDLTIRKGRFLFNGPIDAPWLDVEATRVSKNQDVTAILSLSGPLKNPKTQISSEPALPEAEALAYLITGSPLNQVGKADGNMVASAALSYGAGQLSWLTEKLGVDEFEVKQGKTLQDTLLAVGQYLTPDFYVGTKVGIFNQQAVLVLKHKLSKSINVETQAGTSQRVKLNYELDTD